MTYLYAAYPELKATNQEIMTPMPDPRSPEEVLSMLSQNPPEGEYSVDAF
ncbi:hypothetical protein DJFAAGMI_00658 [Comamonas sp. PE63]|jgi:hypothetical protein|uniref:Uncharacterized protein n=4 Tax=Comamonas TaxID=283 RepID=B7WYY4_COMTK|nr:MULTISPECIES: hypothetical protein [Comamonas]AIJ46398.1 hypothetical protein O987_11395 [Comamonas testosteroni TK102]EED68095.1 hypothetical protein CtesDRAFT_PD3041 [Comamonas testosteroni KF-1]MBS3017928.1 hypothetical protein [Comamonas sp. PE63]WQG66207.1 hypothetical protein SR914_24100 [Comamonas testosteroni]